MAYPTGTDSKWFVGDYASRYSDESALDPGALAAPPSRASYRDRQAQLDADVRKGPDATVAGFLAGFKDRVQSVVEKLGRGDYAGADVELGELEQTRDANIEEIDAFGRYTGGGKTGKNLHDNAWYAKSNEYYQTEVTLPDGTQTTVGKALRPGTGRGIRDSRGDLLNKAGFEDPAVHAAYFSDDARLRAAVQLFVDPALRQDATMRHPGVTVEAQMKVNPIHRQLSAAASYVASNWSKDDGTGIADVFGDGAMAFLQSVFTSHKDSGGIATMIEALTKNTASMAPTRPDLRGTALANYVLAGYDDMIGAITRGDDRVDARGNRVATETLPESRAMADASLVAASTELMRRGVPLDFRNPVTKSRALEVMGEITRLGDDRINIWARAKNHSVDIAAEAGRYIAGDSDSSNFFYNMRDVRQQYNRLVKCGRTVSEVVSMESGHPGDYASNLTKKLGEKPVVPALGHLKDDVWAALSDQIADPMLRGANGRVALSRIMGDPDAAGQFTAKIESAILHQFAGAGRYDVAKALATSLIDGLRTGGGITLEDELFRIGFEDQDFIQRNPQAAESARNWYYGNVAKDFQFAELKARTYRHLRSAAGGNYSEADTQAILARLSEQSARLIRGVNGRSGNGALPFLARLNQHERYQEVWTPVTGRDGKPRSVSKNHKVGPNERVLEVKDKNGSVSYVLARRSVRLGLEDVSGRDDIGKPEDAFRQRALAREYEIAQEDAALERREKIKKSID